MNMLLGSSWVGIRTGDALFTLPHPVSHKGAIFPTGL